jgi:Zn-dependent protease with chaperone function
MFNNIIYFIFVLLIFNIPSPGNAAKTGLLFCVSGVIFAWLVFMGYCRWSFGSLLRILDQGTTDDGSLASRYHRLVAKLSILAVVLFALATFLFDVKYWILNIPGFQHFSVLQGAIALALFFFYLSTTWYFAYPSYRVIFQQDITRHSYIRANLRLNIPILFPWLVFSVIYDLIDLSPWAGPKGFLNSVQGQIVFFACVLTILMIFVPSIIQYLWGCKPLKASEKGRLLECFLKEKGFRYRALLNWPIFEGRMLTAGIMGILPRFRYILITKSLLEALSLEELKGVLAHEMGHARYYHLFFYMLFFVGFVVLSFGLFDLFFYLSYANPSLMAMISEGSNMGVSLFYLLLSIPMLFSLLIYFRYIMGFFMRNFERQADLYSAVTMGTPGPTITSLEKIGVLSGKIRDLPSWHHFSIRERVEYLWRTIKDPGLVRRHNRFIVLSFSVYLICLVGLGYFLNFSPMKQQLAFSLLRKELSQQVLKEPNNMALYENLAVVYQELGKYDEAMEAYNRILEIDPNRAVSLNNLAWLLVTVPQERLRDESRALDLAKKAVSLERSPIFLDTLAEAYYVEGFKEEAVAAIREAIALEKGDTKYYEKQLEKFLTGMNS